MNWKLLNILIVSIRAFQDPGCIRAGANTVGRSDLIDLCTRNGKDFICQNNYEDRNLIKCGWYGFCVNGRTQTHQSCQDPMTHWFNTCKGTCVAYLTEAPPCNHACAFHPGNTNAFVKPNCKPRTCVNGKWVLSANDRPFVCEIGQQDKWIQDIFSQKPLVWSNSYYSHIGPYQPEDTKNKLSVKQAKVQKLPTLRYKGGEVWLRCRVGHNLGKIGFKLKCDDTPGATFGKITLHHWETGALATKADVTSFPCQRDSTACPALNIPANAVSVDCSGRYCKPKCQPGYAQKDQRKYKCGNDLQWYVAGQPVTVLPECVTCPDVAPNLNADVVTNKITDKTKTHTILKGNGLMELQVNCTSKDMILTFNDQDFTTIMKKPTPHKVMYGVKH